MQTEPAQELCSIQCHFFLQAAVCVIFIAKGYFAVLDFSDTVVADGYLMGIPPEVFDDLLWSSKRSFSIYHPFFAVQCFAHRFFQGFIACIYPLEQPFHKLVLKHVAHRLNRKEECSIVFRLLPAACCVKASAKYNHMYMRMQTEVLSPGV